MNKPLLPGDMLRVLESLPKDRPVVMLNLLRFRDQAAYDDPSEACSGREAYRRYGQTAFRAVSAIGGSVVFRGEAHASLLAPPDERWHEVILVRYPSIAAFREMLSQPEYQAGVRHRTAALADSRLVPMTEPDHAPAKGA